MYYCTNIDVKNCNNEYIKSLFVLLDINLTSITNVFFRNNNAYIYFTNSFSKLEFLNCARLSRSKLVDTAYKYICIRDYLDKLAVKRGHVYYHSITSDLISGYKCVINNNIRDYELRPLVWII